MPELSITTIFLGGTAMGIGFDYSTSTSRTGCVLCVYSKDVAPGGIPKRRVDRKLSPQNGSRLSRDKRRRGELTTFWIDKERGRLPKWEEVRSQSCPKPLGKKDRGSLNGGAEHCRRVDHSVQDEVGLYYTLRSLYCS